MVEIVLTRSQSGQFQFTVADATGLSGCDIALVDTQSPHGPRMLEQMRARQPHLIAACICDKSTTGESRFQIPRRSLLLLLQRTLEQIVREELSGSNKVQNQSNTSTNVRPQAIEAIEKEGAALSYLRPLVTRQARADELVPLVALVVDDSLAVRRQLESALERAGIHSISVENADLAMNELVQRNFDLVFLDVVMPGIDGYELCRKIKQNTYTRGTPVLMLTSRSSPFDRARGALAGCDSYLAKPITWDSFYTSVDKLLSKQFHDDRSVLLNRGYRAAGGQSRFPIMQEKTEAITTKDKS